MRKMSSRGDIKKLAGKGVADDEMLMLEKSEEGGKVKTIILRAVSARVLQRERLGKRSQGNVREVAGGRMKKK